MGSTGERDASGRKLASALEGWKYSLAIWIAVAAALAYLIAVLTSGWRDVFHAVLQVGPYGIAVALLLSSVNYLLRFARWQIYLGSMESIVPVGPSLAIYLSGFSLTTTPGKAGEAIRGLMLQRWGVPYRKSLAALFSERLSDLTAVVLLALLGITQHTDSDWIVVTSGCAVALGLFVLSRGRLLGRISEGLAIDSRFAKMVRGGLAILAEASRCHTIRVLAVATVLSTIAWAAEAVGFFVILQLMGLEVSMRDAVAIYSLSMLAGAISMLPGGLGGAEAIMVALLMAIGVPAPQAIAATILVRLATLWFAVVIGLITMITQQRQLGV